MKKTRLLSLLLAAVMTASSLPIMATSVSAAGTTQKVPAGVELLTGTETASNWSGELQATNKSHGTHLRWQTYFSSRTSDLVIKNITAPAAATDYYVKLVVRSQAASGKHGWRIQNGSGTNVNSVVGTAFTGSGANQFEINSGDNTATFIVKMAMAAGATTCTVRIRGNNTYYNFVPKEIYSVGVYSDAACTSSVWNSTITATGIGANLEWKNNSAAVVNARDFMRVPAIALNGGDPANTNYNSAASFNVNKVLTPGTYELSFDARQTYFFRESNHNSVEYEYEYQKLLGTSSRENVVPVRGLREIEKDPDGARTVIPDADVAKVDVSAKTYNGSSSNKDFGTDISTDDGSHDSAYPAKMTGDGALSTKLYHALYLRAYGFRNYNDNAAFPKVNNVRTQRSFFAFDTINTYYHANYRDVKVQLKGDTSAIKAENVRIDDKWASKKITFTVTQPTTLSAISFGGTGKAYDNDAFDIDNLSLKMVEPEYTVTNDAIESGLLVGATKNYTTVVDAEVDYTDVTTVPGDYAKNGYISTNRLPWYFRTNTATRHDNAVTSVAGWGSNDHFVYMKLDEAVTNSTTLGVSFRARAHVPANTGVTVCARFYSGNVSKGHVTVNSNDWTEYSGTYTLGANKSNIEFDIRRGTSAQDAPIDLDDLMIWIDTNKDAVCDPGEKVLYSENYNDADKEYIANEAGKLQTKYINPNAARLGNAELYHNFDETYAKISGSGCSLSYTNLDEESGVYTFSAEVQVPYHRYENMRNKGDYGPADRVWTADSTEAKDYYEANDHDIAVTFTMTDGSDEKTKTVSLTDAITNTWDTITASVIVDEGYTLTGVKVVPTFSKLPDGSEAVPDENKALNFKNVTLVEGEKIKGTVEIDQVEYENFLDNATEKRVNAFYESIAEVTDDGETNGYITVDRRTWYWNSNMIWYGNKDKEQGYNACINLLQLNFPNENVAGWKYYIQLDARHHAPTDVPQRIQIRFNDDGNNRALNNYLLSDTSGNWMTGIKSNVWTSTLASGTGNLAVRIRSHEYSRDIPLDFDNIKIWREKDGQTVVIYDKDFNSAEEGYFTTDGGALYNSDGTALYLNFDESFGRLTPDVSVDPVVAPSLHYTDLKDDAGNLHGEGTYVFSADIRVPFFNYNDISSIDAAQRVDGVVPLKWAHDDSQLEGFYAYNEHKVNVTFVQTSIEDPTVTKTTVLEKTITSVWGSLESAVIVDPGYILTDIKIVPEYSEKFADMKDKWSLDYKNIVLRHSDFPVLDIEESDNFLDGAKATPVNLISTEIIEDAPDGELQIGDRTGVSNQNHYFNITLDETAKADRTYYVGFKVRTTVTGQTTVVRPVVNVLTDTEDTVNNIGRGDVNDNYLVPVDSNSKLSASIGTEAGYNKYNNGQYDTFREWQINNSYYVVNVNNSEQYIQGMFSPASTASTKLKISFRPGPGSFPQAIAIDDIEVWYYDNNNEKVVVYENNFNSEGDSERGISGNGGAYTIEHILPKSHTLYTPIDETQPMSVTYELDIAKEDAVEGKYVFKALAKLAEDTDKSARVLVTFNYNDGTTKEHYMELTTDWSIIGISGWLDRLPDLESVTLTFESDVPVMIVNPVLTIRYKYFYGRPNSGIVMVLMKKLQGKMTDPWKQVGVN